MFSGFAFQHHPCPITLQNKTYKTKTMQSGASGVKMEEPLTQGSLEVALEPGSGECSEPSVLTSWWTPSPAGPGSGEGALNGARPYMGCWRPRPSVTRGGCTMLAGFRWRALVDSLGLGTGTLSS